MWCCPENFQFNAYTRCHFSVIDVGGNYFFAQFDIFGIDVSKIPRCQILFFDLSNYVRSCDTWKAGSANCDNVKRERKRCHADWCVREIRSFTVHCNSISTIVTWRPGNVDPEGIVALFRSFRLSLRTDVRVRALAGIGVPAITRALLHLCTRIFLVSH